MNVIKSGTALVITSNITKEQYNNLMHFSGRDALALIDQETKAVKFRIAYSKGAAGAIDNSGVVFNSVNKDGLLTATIITEIKVSEIARNFGKALLSLKKLEESVSENVAAVDADIADINTLLSEMEDSLD